MNSIRRITELFGNMIIRFFRSNKEAQSIGIIGSSDGPTSVFITNVKSRYKYKNSPEKFNEWLDKVANEIRPCGKTLDEVEIYLKEKYHAKKVDISPYHAQIIKSNIILNHFPDLLTSPSPQFNVQNKPTRKQIEQFAQASEKRQLEAMEYPVEKLNLDIHVYEFPLENNGQRLGMFRVTVERTTEQCTIGFIGGQKLGREIKKISDETVKDIYLFRGVTQEDIDNRTPRFMSYATTLKGLQ